MRPPAAAQPPARCRCAQGAQAPALPPPTARAGAPTCALARARARSNNLRNDLNHPNEYIRGCTLRFLCKLREAEILEPLIPTIKANLDHRHSFVRRNAVLAVFSIYQNFDYLIPDGPDLVEQVLLAESDASCKRNAFLMLFHSAQDRAVAFLSDNLDAVAGYGDILQLVVLELIRKIVRANPFEKSKYIR